MDSVNKTLYIPLYGKSFVSRMGLFLNDPMAEKIWDRVSFPLTGKAGSKWLAYYMGMRAAVFDQWVLEQQHALPQAVVLHLGCGLDSRIYRAGGKQLWYDVDFPEVIAERKKYFAQTDVYRMISGDLREAAWLEEISGDTAIVVMEGITMYLTPEELNTLLKRLGNRFSQVRLLMDCYTELGAKASKIKNPINEVGVTQVYGLDDPHAPVAGTNLGLVQEHSMTPRNLIRQLKGAEWLVFQALYGGAAAKSMYRMYSYESVNNHAD